AHAALKGAVDYRFGRSLSYRQAQEIARYYLAAASPLPSLRPRLRMSAQKAAEVLPSLLENFEDFDFAPKILPLLGEARLPEFADVFSRIALRGKNAAVREAALDALRQSPSLPEAARDRLVMLLLDSSEAGGKTRRMNLTAAAILEKAASRKFALAGAIAGWTAGAAVSAAGLPFVGALLSLAGAYAGALRDFSGNTGLSPKLHLRTPELRSLFVAPVFSTAVAAACAFALLGLIRLAGGPQLALLETLAATGLAAGLVALHWSFKRP
ncbi:MAG: hypothetical protein HY611_00825, partial [Elusimicrobia bacterium]|nr:hypothetical protein [Elusimicrobiota bacterium]